MGWGEHSIDFIWANDGLNYLVPAHHLSRERTLHDDDGFTNDLTLCLAAARPRTRLAVCVKDRMITEREGLRRADEIDAELSLERTRSVGDHWSLSSFAALGFVATGPLGGAQFQDKFHRLIDWGRTLNGEIKGQLQTDYEGGVRVAPRLRAGGSVQRQLSADASLSAGGEVAVSRGAGASYGQIQVAARRGFPVGQGRLTIFGSVALRRLRAEEIRLTFPGAYPQVATFPQGSAGFSYARPSWEIGFALLLNVEGTGAHQGALSYRKKI